MDLLDNLRLLIRLQDIDMAIHSKEIAIKELPLVYQSRCSELDALYRKIEERNASIAQLRKQEERLINSINRSLEEVREKKNQLLLTSDQQQYNTIIKAIDSLEKMIRTAEEEKLLLYEELTIQQKLLTDYTADYEQQQLDIQQMQLELEPTLSTYQTECLALQQERTSLIQDIAIPLYSRYEFIRNRIPYPVLSSIQEGICSSCRIVLPTQTTMDVLAGKQLYPCPSCQRILYPIS